MGQAGEKESRAYGKNTFESTGNKTKGEIARSMPDVFDLLTKKRKCEERNTYHCKTGPRYTGEEPSVALMEVRPEKIGVCTLFKGGRERTYPIFEGKMRRY